MSKKTFVIKTDSSGSEYACISTNGWIRHKSSWFCNPRWHYRRRQNVCQSKWSSFPVYLFKLYLGKLHLTLLIYDNAQKILLTIMIKRSTVNRQ
jgi:hypothetical protein